MRRPERGLSPQKSRGAPAGDARLQICPAGVGLFYDRVQNQRHSAVYARRYRPLRPRSLLPASGFGIVEPHGVAPRYALFRRKGCVVEAPVRPDVADLRLDFIPAGL